MTADYSQLQVGNVVTPLSPSTANTLLRDADPALYNVLSFFEGLVRIHLGARWDAEVAAAGVSELVGKVVATTFPCDPIDYLVQAQSLPPILAVYRISSGFIERTRHYSQKIGTWGFDWILPPLSAGQVERLLPFRNAIEALLLERIDRGFDPAYQSGAQVFKVAGITGFKLTEGQYTRLAPRVGTNLSTFEELHLQFEVREQVRPRPDDFMRMDGASVAVSGTNADGTYPDVSNVNVSNTG